MSETTTTFVRTAVAFGAVLFAATAFAGVVGAMLRFSHGTFAGMGPPGTAHGMVAPGFQFGFGVPLATVLVRIAIVIVPFAAGYLLYVLATEAVRRSERDRDARHGSGPSA